jgi:riboflavin kinase/FMN adenylyltransferase
MEVITGLDNIQESADSVITVGNFDGIHLGHRRLLEKVTQIAAKRKFIGTLLTFDRHPRSVVSSSPVSKVKILTNLDEKIEIVEKFNLDRVIIVKFTREFSELSYQHFLENILIARLGMRVMVLGHDHAFGRNRAGNVTNLESLKAKHRFELIEVGAHKLGDLTVSSTLIRDHLLEGNITQATAMLGRPYSISGIVVRGDGRGKRLSFPTANIAPENQSKLVPREGVYAVDCIIHDEQFRGMANIGYKPTFGSADKTIEINLFDFDRDIYGDRIAIHFLKRLRDEMKFGNEQDLISQLKKDKSESYTL